MKATASWWRDVPVDNGDWGIRLFPRARNLPDFCRNDKKPRPEFERDLFIIRRSVELAVNAANSTRHALFLYPVTVSYTVLYKGLLLSSQLGPYYDDWRDTDTVSAMALVHQRFSTNTFPTWSLAQPFMICHNGEINRARQY